jgi:RNA polymerase sigma-70 factor, ECF subfamily
MGTSELTLEQEQALVERALDGDGEAFGRIYDAYKGIIYATVIHPRLNNQQVAEEVLQETFLLALKKLREFQWQERSILFWLRMIAVNKVHERLNQDKRSGGTVDDSVIGLQPDTTWQPENLAVEAERAKELRFRIRGAMENLNERYRKAMELRLGKKLTREKCALELGVTMETFDVLFFRACKSFREKYIKKYGELDV